MHTYVPQHLNGSRNGLPMAMPHSAPDVRSRARRSYASYDAPDRGSARGWVMGWGRTPAPYQLSRTRHIVSPKGEPNTQTIRQTARAHCSTVAYRSGFLTLIAVTLQSPASLLPTDQTLHSLRLTSSPPQTPTRHSWSRSYARQLGKISQPWHANPNTTSSNTVMQIR